MALFRCGGAGAPTKTTLWTNAAPTSEFAGQTVTLSSPISDFDLIEIKARASSSSPTANAVIVDVATLQTLANSTSSPIGVIAYHTNDVNSGTARKFFYTSDTSITFSDNTLIKATSGANNNNVIPVEINGIKF